MKKLSLHQKFELKTYLIEIKDDWIQFSVATPEMDILESILQEKEDKVYLALLQRMGCSVAEKQLVDSENSNYIEEVTKFYTKLLEVAKKDKVDESVVRKAMSGETIYVDGDGKVSDDEKGILTKLDYELKPEDKTLLMDLAGSYVKAQNEYLNAMTVCFINTRLIDLDTKKSIKNNYSIEQLTNLHNDLLDKVKEFVSWELFGYPDDEPAEELNSEKK